MSTDRGDVIRARFVSLASGPLNRPKLPGIPGIRDFKGHTFHTSRWDYDYTGGTAEGGLDKLADKRIAVIGTGYGSAVRAASCGRCRASIRLPAHTVEYRRAGQPPHRPRVGR